MTGLCHQHVFHHAEAGVNLWDLKRTRHTEPRDLSRRHGVDTLPAQMYFSAVGLYVAGDHIDKCGFACPVTADQADAFTAANADIDVKDGGATIVDADHSLLGDGTVDSVVTLVGSGNLRSNAPGLGALADNGGLTKTMALLTGSPAIDAGPNPVATFTGNGFDQRATPYLRVYGGQVDIGAFEWQPTPTPSTTTTTTATASSDPVAPAFTG